MKQGNEETRRRLADAFSADSSGYLARLRRAGKSLEEAEDVVQDVWAEAIEKLPLLSGVTNISAWVNTLFGRRVIDAWRQEKGRQKVEHPGVADETLEEIIAGAGMDPLDTFVRETLSDALSDALGELPKEQRRVIEAQVYGGMTFQEISDQTGESLDTLMARKRYGISKLSHALRHWVES